MLTQRLPEDVTIEEIGDLVKSLNETDTYEMIDCFLDDATKLKLIKYLLK